MNSGINILVITNNERIIPLLSEQLVFLRNIDSILIRSYENAIATIKEEQPQTIIVSCTGSTEEVDCLNLIHAIKTVTKVPIILLLEYYHNEFIALAAKEGISDCLPLLNCKSEILMRTIWNLKRNEKSQKYNKHIKLLKQLGVINKTSNFYSEKYKKQVFDNEFEHTKTTSIGGVFMEIEKNPNAENPIENKFLEKILAQNTRGTDVVAHAGIGKFHLLLTSTNLSGATIVWERINSAINSEGAICGAVCDIENYTFNEAEKLVNKLIKQAEKEASFFKIDIKEEIEQPLINEFESKKVTNNKLFEQIFQKKVDRFIQPALETIKITGANSQIVRVDNDYIELVLSKKEHKSSIKFYTQGNAQIKIKIKHSGLDSPENSSFAIDMNELKLEYISSIIKNFTNEFLQCLD